MAGEDNDLTGEILLTRHEQEVSGTTAAILPQSFGWVRSVSNEITTPHFEMQAGYRKTENGISPRLYFKYIKTKFSIIENTMFKRRMKQLENMVDEYAKLGQEALSDECIRQFCIIAKESAMWACGLKKFILKDHVDKFKYRVKGDVKITSLKNFARVIPEKAARSIKFTMDKRLFDNYVVVHLDDKDRKSTKETDKERIEREKDPICFGRINEAPERFYFVCDWEDELCILRLDDIIKKLSLKDKDIKLTHKIDKWRAKAKESKKE